MKKKLLSLALVLVMAFTLLPTAAFAEGLDGEGETPPAQTSTDPANDPANDPSNDPSTDPANEPSNDPAGDPAPAPAPAPEAETDPAPAPQTGAAGDCTRAQGCTAATHEEGCPEICTKADTCTATITHDPDCPKVSTNTGTGSGSSTNPSECTHPAKTETQEQPATCTAKGNIHYWECKTCHTKFSDGTGTVVTDVTTPMIAHTFDKTATPPTGKCTVCQYVCPHTSQTAGAPCGVCGKTVPASTTPPAVHVHDPLVVVSGTAATCNAPGTQLHYKCPSCNQLFSDPEGKNAISKPVEIPATGKHTPPADGTGKTVDSGTHTYTCTTCGTTGISGSHIYNSSSVCTVCGFHGTPSSPYRYIDITTAYVNSYSISVTWASDLPEGTTFEIYVDGSWRTTVTPAKSGSYFSATVSSSYYLEDSYYNVAVYRYGDHTVGDSIRVYGRYYDHDYDHWYWDNGYWRPTYRPDYNTTPSTNSSGIPYASQVTGRYSASEAIRILRNTNAYSLQNELMGSSSARSSYDSLERAVKSANNVSVSVSANRAGVPSALRSGSGFQISGAAFNASRTNSTVRLVVDAPSRTRYTGHGYQFSMTLTGVDSASSLDVPVVVSMPLPSDINSSFVRVLHYHNSNTPTVIVPQVSGGRIRFTLTGFSDFVITDNAAPFTYVSDGYGGYYVPVGQLVDRRSLAEEPLSLAVVPTGYVYNDVTGTYWASGAIAWAQNAGVMTGYYDGSFRPYAGTTRQELWMVLARLAGASPSDMRAAREWAMNAGITDGRNPESPLSNQQMITMLYRYASYRGMNLTAPTTNLSLYRDGASVSPYARTPMAWAINRGIVNGNGTGYLHPQSIATRADFAVYLYRFVQ